MSETPPNPPELPKILEQLKEVKSEASELRNFTITFLSLLLYVNLIIAGTSHEQILRVAPVTLPLLNVPLPIIGFYSFLPWLLLFFHLYLLVQHYLFSRELFHFKKALDAIEGQGELHAYIRKNLGNLPFLHWMVNQGGPVRHGPAMAVVLTIITLVCLIVWPLITLLWLQMAILPYHGETLIWSQRWAIISDVLLVGWLWPKVLDADDSNAEPAAWAWWKPVFTASLGSLFWLLSWLWPRWPSRPALSGQIRDAARHCLPPVLLGALLSATLFLSLLVAVLPDSWEEKLVIGEVNGGKENPSAEKPFWLLPVDVKRGEYSRYAFFPVAWLHENHAKFLTDATKIREALGKGAKPCPITEQRKAEEGGKDPGQNGGQKTAKTCLLVPPWLPRNLVLRERVLSADATLKPELEAKLQWNAEEDDPSAQAPSPGGNAAAAKDQQATLEDTLAQIQGLNLQNRNLEYADFTESSLPKADLRFASLSHAVFHNARLDQVLWVSEQEEEQRVSINLQYLDLSGAKLTGAKLPYADLTGADLSKAQLPGSNLSYAQLPGADLSYAQLPGADLSHAQLPGADLSHAHLPGANLHFARLPGADLSLAQLPGTDLSFAQLPGASLYEAQLPGADLFNAHLPGTDLSFAQLPGAYLFNAHLPGADLSNAQLVGAGLSGVEFDYAVLAVDFSVLSDEKMKQAAKQLRQALALRKPYKNDPKRLAERMDHFTQDIKASPIFSRANKTRPCLRLADDKAKAFLPNCQIENEVNATWTSEFAAEWVNLACKDTTEGHWMARRMVERANNGQHLWFAQPLQQAAQDPKTCPGLAGLPEYYKARLQALGTH